MRKLAQEKDSPTRPPPFGITSMGANLVAVTDRRVSSLPSEFYCKYVEIKSCIMSPKLLHGLLTDRAVIRGVARAAEREDFSFQERHGYRRHFFR